MNTDVDPRVTIILWISFLAFCLVGLVASQIYFAGYDENAALYRATAELVGAAALGLSCFEFYTRHRRCPRLVVY